MRRDKNAIAVESVHMSMLRVNMVEELAKKYPIVEAEMKKFQARRLAAMANTTDSLPTADATGRTECTANRAKGEAELDSVVPARGQTSDITSVLKSRAGEDGYASAGGPAQEVRDKSGSTCDSMYIGASSFVTCSNNLRPGVRAETLASRGRHFAGSHHTSRGDAHTPDARHRCALDKDRERRASQRTTVTASIGMSLTECDNAHQHHCEPYHYSPFLY